MSDICKFKPGDRVQVVGDDSWPASPAGIVDFPPDYARKLVEHENAWQGWHRTTSGVKGDVVTYWMWFDVPTLEYGNYGPYTGGEIAESNLRSAIHLG